MYVVDEFDKKIISILNEDGRTSFLNISKELGVSNTMVHQRVSKLMESGVISSIRPILNEKKIGYDLSSFTGITLEKDYKENPRNYRMLFYCRRFYIFP